MSISATLNTNEVKNAAGTEVEFCLRSTGPGSQCEFQQIAESPAYPHRIGISHQETGVGMAAVRRSRLGTYKTVPSTVDVTRSAPIAMYSVLVYPKGLLLADTEVKNVMAEHISLLASTGADTVIKFDCTGTGADVLLNARIV